LEGEQGSTHIDKTVSRSLRSDQRSTPASTLSGQDALPLVLGSLICTEHVANLSSTNTNVSRGDIGVGTDMLAQLAHEGNAELADLVIGLALGVEVCSSLAATDVHCPLISLVPGPKRENVSRELTSSQGILEDLLEAQEFQNRQVDGGMQTETALVWAESRVELHPVAAIDLDLVLVVLPDDAELDDPFGDGDDLEGGLVFGMLLEEGAIFEG